VEALAFFLSLRERAGVRAAAGLSFVLADAPSPNPLPAGEGFLGGL